MQIGVRETSSPLPGAPAPQHPLSPQRHPLPMDDTQLDAEFSILDRISSLSRPHMMV